MYTVKFVNPDHNCYGEGAQFALLRDNEQVATVTMSFCNKAGYSTSNDVIPHAVTAEWETKLTPIAALMLVMNTVWGAWLQRAHDGIDSFEAVFSGSVLVVDPALYRNSECDDSDSDSDSDSDRIPHSYI